MAGNTYGYSTYTNLPAQRDGYGVVETKDFDRVPASKVSYTNLIDSASVVEPLKEHGHTPTMSGGPKYAPKNHYDDYKSNYRVTYENSSQPLGQNKYTHDYFSKESNKVHSGPGNVKTGSISSPNKSWQAVGPLATHHPLATPTNDIDEALGFLQESMNSPLEFERRNGYKQYGKFVRPRAFVPKPQGPRERFTYMHGGYFY